MNWSVKSKVIPSMLSVLTDEWPCTCETQPHLQDSVIHLHWHCAGSAECVSVDACASVCVWVFFCEGMEKCTLMMFVISTASISILSMLCPLCVFVCGHTRTHSLLFVLQTSDNEYKCALHFTSSALSYSHRHTRTLKISSYDITLKGYTHSLIMFLFFFTTLVFFCNWDTTMFYWLKWKVNWWESDFWFMWEIISLIYFLKIVWIKFYLFCSLPKCC